MSDPVTGVRPLAPPEVTDRELWSLRASIGGTRVARNAGAVPKTTAVRTPAANAKSSTRESSDRSRNAGAPARSICASNALLIQLASTSPTHPPTRGKDQAFDQELTAETPAR